MTLPNGTSLGRLSLVEVYVDYDGPKLFSTVSESGNYFIAVATDEDDSVTRWLYAPVSRKMLERVRAGELDVAEPFQRPPDGYLFRVVTPHGRGVDTAESVRRLHVPEEDLPRKGFPLALTTELDQWRLDALRDAARSGERAHEARLVPTKKEVTKVLLPETVAALLRRWDRFWHALFPKQPLRVASVAPGSLRAIFAAPAVMQSKLVDTYEDLVHCGANIPRLHQVTKARGVAAAYYELVHFVAEEACDLELASARGTSARSQKLDVLTLPTKIAEAQGRALAQPQEARRERRFLADVLAASKTRGTLELAIDKGERLEGGVSLSSRKFITGLKIGGHYSFDLTEMTRVDVPGATPRIELDLHAPPLPQDDTVAAPSPRRQRTKPGIALAWRKLLSATDAQHAPSGATRTYVPLSRSGQAMDVHTWFREEFFGEYGWARSSGHEERVTVEMDVIIDSGVKLGPQSFVLSHDPTRARNKDEPPTRLHWNHAMLEFLRRNDSYVKGTMTLLRNADGGYELHLVQRPPDVRLRRARPRGRTSG